MIENSKNRNIIKLEPANVRNVNATANLVINSIIEILFTLIWNSCIISMVIRIWNTIHCRKRSNIIQKFIISSV